MRDCAIYSAFLWCWQALFLARCKRQANAVAELVENNDGNGEEARVHVLLPLPFAAPLDYKVDGELEALLPGTFMPGTFVKVTVSGKPTIGVVWDAPDVPHGKVYPLEKLKPVDEIVSLPPMSNALRRFVDWVARYTLSPLGSVLRMCMPAPSSLMDVPLRAHYQRAALPEGLRMTPARQSVLDALSDGRPRTSSEIAEACSVSAAVVSGLAKAGALQTVHISVDAPFPKPDLSIAGPTLSEEQSVAATAICAKVKAGGFETFLLDGVTGSGKTEVYFEGLAEALKSEGTQVLVLVPEIALTSQWLERFAHRFGVEPVVWHSDIGTAARRRAWRAIASGEARVVVGARSALFLPFQNLGFITVDEEHDPSFKQEEGVLYHARDMAVVRAKLADCALVLASATPSLETLVNADAGRYTKLVLRERHGKALLPQMHAVDMRIDAPAAGQWLSPKLIAQIEATLASGEQVMLFLNRRGYAPLTLCRTCGHRLECPNCSTWLVEHRFRADIQCHQCGYMAPVPKICGECKTEDSLVACGPGVERLFEEVNHLFPDARTTVMTSDTMTSPNETARMVQEIADGRLDIVIGTQIVTKGYHFPNLTLVGVIDADLGLRGGDLRAGERTYQQLVQVSGRAGRADKPGRVLLQTYEPEHPVVHALLEGDGDAFLAAECSARERHHMPPYGQLVSVILSGIDLAHVMEQGRRLAAKAPGLADVIFMGPAPAPLSRIRGRHRARLLVHAKKRGGIQRIIADWLNNTPKVKGVRIRVDIDPHSFL